MGQKSFFDLERRLAAISSKGDPLELSPEYFEQLTSEVRRVRMVRRRPTQRFERKPGMAAEALDAAVYGLAARQALNLSEASFAARLDELRNPTPPAPPRPSVIRSEWMSR
jgi:phage terminase large subunit GpA-like protein